MKNLSLLFIIVLINGTLSWSQTKNREKNNNEVKFDASIPCSPGTANVDLDIGNVRATILTDGDMWWNLSNPSYEVPKGFNKHSLFAGALWFGGVDQAGDLRVAAQTYRQTGSDFWPGPLDTVNASTNSTVCNMYNKLWKVTRAGIINFIQNGTTTPDLLSWPGNGNAALNQGQFLAPFFDVNGDGVYDPSQGDYPNYDLQGSGSNCYEVLHGDQTLWWAFNDVGNIHSNTGSDPIGLEVQAQAFAYNSGIAAINNATFYQYKVINRSSNQFNDCYIGNWVDTDLGNPTDDYIGCDVNRGLAYCYNGDMDDDGLGGYGIDPPAVGMDFLKGPLADAGDGIDNDRDGVIDEAGEEIFMSNLMVYENINNAPNGNPTGFNDYYNYLRSVWLDGIHLTYGGNGRVPSNPQCNFMFPDHTDSLLNLSNGPWTEATAGNMPDDRRFIQSAGPFTMMPGEVNYVITAVPWARTSPGGGPLGSVLALQQADDIIQLLFENCFIPTGISNIESNPFGVEVAPLPFHQETTVSFANKNGESFTLMLYDIHGKLIQRIQNITGNFVKIERNGIENGVYLLKLSNSKNKSCARKIVAN